MGHDTHSVGIKYILDRDESTVIFEQALFIDESYRTIIGMKLHQEIVQKIDQNDDRINDQTKDRFNDRAEDRGILICPASRYRTDTNRSFPDQLQYQFQKSYDSYYMRHIKCKKLKVLALLEQHTFHLHFCHHQ